MDTLWKIKLRRSITRLESSVNQNVREKLEAKLNEDKVLGLISLRGISCIDIHHTKCGHTYLMQRFPDD